MVRLLVGAWLALLGGTVLAEPAPEQRRSGAGSQAVVQAAATRTITFAGIQWAVKSSSGALWGPGPNKFSAAPGNVWVDEDGRLHLKITREADGWQCAEVVALQSFGHGSYRYTVESELADLDPQVVLGLFTWSDDAAFHHREIDIEFSRWGQPLDTTNAQYTVQPYTSSANLLRWTLPAGHGPTVHSFRWTKASVAFETSAAGISLKQWSYTRRAGIPKPGGENPRINLWLFQGLAPTNGQSVEVIVSRFEHRP